MGRASEIKHMDLIFLLDAKGASVILSIFLTLISITVLTYKELSQRQLKTDFKSSFSRHGNVLSSALDRLNPRQLTLRKELILRFIIRIIIQSTNTNDLNRVLQSAHCHFNTNQNFKNAIN